MTIKQAIATLKEIVTLEQNGIYSEAKAEKIKRLKQTISKHYVNVEYCIGCKQYKEQALKIGKSYISIVSTEKMTRSRGYYFINEI